MPTVEVHLNYYEIKEACQYWVNNGCPEVKHEDVSLDQVNFSANVAGSLNNVAPNQTATVTSDSDVIVMRLAHYLARRDDEIARGDIVVGYNRTTYAERGETLADICSLLAGKEAEFRTERLNVAPVNVDN